MNLEPDLRNLIAEFFNKKTAEIDENTSMNNIEEWDSLEHIKLILEIEGKYKVRFPLEAVPLMTSAVLIQQELNKLK